MREHILMLHSLNDEEEILLTKGNGILSIVKRELLFPCHPDEEEIVLTKGNRTLFY